MPNDITKTFQQIGKVLSKNSPTILTGLAVGGFITTVAMAVKATPKALHIIEMEEKYRMEAEDDPKYLKPMDALDTIEATWECYIPALGMGLLTIGCIIGANTISMRRNAALVSIFSITETTLREYQAKVVQTIGDKKEEKIRAEIAEENMAKNPPRDNTIVMTGKGDYLCMDTYTGRYFRSDVETIRSAVNDFNQKLLQEGWLDINAFYEMLDLPPIEVGDQIGWIAQYAILEVRYTSAMSPKNEPVLVMEYRVQPKQI